MCFLGFLGLEQLYSDEVNVKRHIEDSVQVVAKAFKQLHSERNITSPPTNCSDNSDIWSDGEEVLE